MIYNRLTQIIFITSYQLNAICDCAESCLRTLLGMPPTEMDRISELELRRKPKPSAASILLELSSIAGELIDCHSTHKNK